MKTQTKAAGVLVAAIAALAPSGATGAEYLVPPGNSAATQYTESIPTAGGQRDVERDSSTRRDPAAVLGKRNARRLESRGRTGREAALIAAENAPVGSGANDAGVQPAQANGNAGSGKTRRRAATRDGSTARGPDGSAGSLEVLGQATGVSGGELGPLLPLAVVATTAWAIAFLLRRRQRPTR